MVKKKLIVRTLALALLMTACLAHEMVYAEVRVDPLFGDCMVLQQQSVTMLRGQACPGKKVSVRCSWNRTRQTVRAAADGSWQVAITAPSGGFDPQWIEIHEDNTIRLNNILIGEVWLCAGQSNMEMPMQGFPSQPVEGSLPEISRAFRYKHLRLFNVTHSYAETPQATCGGVWMDCTPEHVATFSAIGYLFGRRLTEALDMPVGIIVSSYGGSRIESWLDEASMKKFDPEDYIAKADKPYRDPCKLYNAMVAPLVGYSIRGVVWLQGESNRRNAHVYASMLTELMALWRRVWQNDRLPFLVCQIAPCPYHGEGELGAARLMEAQYQAVHSANDAYLVGTSDVGAEKFIHFPQKGIVAQRVFISALANVYRIKGLPVSGPTMDRVEYGDHKATVYFRYAGRGLIPTDQAIDGFQLAGADLVFYPARARIGRKDRSTVEVECAEVPRPCAVRYAFSNWHRVNLYNCEGLPAYPFRTDSIQYR